MNLRLHIVRALFHNEFRMILRDRRTIVMAIVLPLIVLPVILFASNWTREHREHVLKETTFRYAVSGSETNWLRELMADARRQIERESGTNEPAIAPFEEAPVTNALQALNDHQIHFFVESGFTNDDTNDSPATVSDENDAAPVVRLVMRGDRDDSIAAAGRIRRALEGVRTAGRIELLQAKGFPAGPADVGPLVLTDLASKRQVAGLTLGRFLTAFLVLCIFSGGVIVASDLVAGERERGTLETLLTTGARRGEIILAKLLVIVTVAAFIVLLQSANLLAYVGFRLIPLTTDFAAAVTPGIALLLFVLFIPLAALIASVLLFTSGYARSYRETQLYFMPVILVALLPALAPAMPELPLRSAVALVPIAGVALAARDILVGSFDWPFIALAWGVTAAMAFWLTRRTVTFLSAERLVGAGAPIEPDPQAGSLRFRSHVGRWFAILWALVWVVNSYLARADVRLQIVVNLVVLFFGASVLILWRYRLNWRETLAMRRPRPEVWLGVACAIPGGLLTASGLSRLAERWFPVSTEMLEEFTRAVLPEGVSLLQLLFFMAILPGIFEEVAFRGLLLNGLHRRLRPVPLAIVVGIVFGLFHFALFRLAGTAFLGIFLAGATLLTGSLFPVMVWHAGNNALAIIAADQGLPLSDLDLKCYGLGAALLLTGFAILWRHRTPYPGLLGRRVDGNG